MKSIQLIISIFIMNVAICNAQNVGMTRQQFEPFYRAQQNTMWCWAASTEMVLATGNINIRQDSIIQRVKGIVGNFGGSPADMIRAANGLFLDTSNVQMLVSGQYVMGAPFPNVLYNSIKQRHPVILTYMANRFSGHAIVIYGLDATVDPHNGAIIHAIYIADPFAYVQNQFGFQFDANMKYKVYHPIFNQVNGAIQIEPGTVTGSVFVNATNL